MWLCNLSSPHLSCPKMGDKSLAWTNKGIKMETWAMVRSMVCATEESASEWISKWMREQLSESWTEGFSQSKQVESDHQTIHLSLKEPNNWQHFPLHLSCTFPTTRDCSFNDLKWTCKRHKKQPDFCQGCTQSTNMDWMGQDAAHLIQSPRLTSKFNETKGQLCKTEQTWYKQLCDPGWMGPQEPSDSTTTQCTSPSLLHSTLVPLSSAVVYITLVPPDYNKLDQQIPHALLSFPFRPWSQEAFWYLHA